MNYKKSISENWLGFVNMYFFQWFFIRLTKHVQSAGGGYKTKYWSIQGFIVPGTGWNVDYKYLGRVRFFRITKRNLYNSFNEKY